MENLLSGEPVGVVGDAVVVFPVTGRIPFMDEAFTLNGPSIPFFASSRNIAMTSLSLMVELNFSSSSSSTIKLPQLGRETGKRKKTRKVSNNFKFK